MADTLAELKVRRKFPLAVCKTGGRPPFQIWNMLFSFAGEKLGEGRTEREAWKDADKKSEKP